AQDVRGRFASEGDFYAFVNEGKDGYDIIEWAAAQPWSNGKVGTFGASYLAWDQYAAAMYEPPHLVAMFANVGGADFWREFGRPGGAPNLGWPLWMLKSAETSPQAAQNATAREPLTKVLSDPAAWFALDPQKRGEIFHGFPAHARMYRDLYDHETFDGYWRQEALYIPGQYGRMKDVPIFFISGWFDYFGEGVLQNFADLSRTQKTMKKLWMGPWPHGVGSATCGDGDFGPAAAVDVNALTLDWFDHWMKGSAFQVAPPEAVRLFRMGGGSGGRDAKGRLEHGGEWRPASIWPPAGPILSEYYLHGDGVLSPARPGGEPPTSFVYDPAHPVPTIGGRYGVGRWTPNCAQNQVCSLKILGCTDSLPLDRRADVLSFSTAPLKKSVEVTGKIRAALWVSSDAVDTDFTAKLIDVYPDGYALILTDGLIRMRYRDGPDKVERMRLGAVYEAVIDLGSTSNLFGPGHRIRLDISSSNYPRVEPNPNSGEPAVRPTRRVEARNTVYHERGRASYVALPMVVAP
ncbi:MAG TPA: CocE/NonD family hydrolase, partial [Bryobacterales bacterium]|nr:CocE/NonD family hydrolase [Bryobacterales bacterium]